MKYKKVVAMGNLEQTPEQKASQELIEIVQENVSAKVVHTAQDIEDWLNED